MKTERKLLQRGDRVGVVAPGFAVKRALLDAGVAKLRRMGFDVALGRHVLARDGYLAGDDRQRTEDLAAMLRDPEVRAIWFARGGYGTARILSELPWAAYRKDPKPLIGYSDLTALFAAALRQARGRCIYGPVVTELGDPAWYHGPSIRALLAGRGLSLRFRARDVLAPGRAAGPLMGGNLSVLTHLCGSRFMPPLRGAVLFFEEIGEPTYRIDRLLTQLRMAGALDGLAGVLIGNLTVPLRRRFPPDRDLSEVLRECFAPLGVPVVRNLPAGHIRGKRSLPLGAEVTIDTGSRRLIFEP